MCALMKSMPYPQILHTYADIILLLTEDAKPFVFSHQHLRLKVQAADLH